MELAESSETDNSDRVKQAYENLKLDDTKRSGK